MSTELQKSYESPFIKKMIKILNSNQYYNIIRWDQTKTMIDIISVQKMEELVLPQYFRHNRFSSFIRQLNLYGFKKMRKTGIQRFSHKQLMNGQGLLSIGSRRKNLRERLESELKQEQQSQFQMLAKQQEVSGPRKKDKQSQIIPTSKTIHQSINKQTKQIKENKQSKNSKNQQQAQQMHHINFPYFITPPFPPVFNGSMISSNPMQHNHSIPQNHYFPGGMQMMHPYSFPGYYPYSFAPMGYPPGPMMGFPHSYPFMPQNIQGNQLSQSNHDNAEKNANQSISNNQSCVSQNNFQSSTNKRQKN